jgi:hypothetical protein
VFGKRDLGWLQGDGTFRQYLRQTTNEKEAKFTRASSLDGNLSLGVTAELILRGFA